MWIAMDPVRRAAHVENFVTVLKVCQLETRYGWFSAEAMTFDMRCSA